MRPFWCVCGQEVLGDVEHVGGCLGRYEASFFDSGDRHPVDNCPECDEPLYQQLVDGQLREQPPEPTPEWRKEFR